MDTTLYIVRGNAAIVAGQPDDLFTTAQSLIRRSPFNPLGYEFQGLTLENQANLDLAYRFYQVAYFLPETAIAQRRMKILRDFLKAHPKDAQ